MGSIYSLVRSAQNGNDKAKQHLYKDTSNKAYYIAYVLLGDKELVQKALSNVYLTMFTEIGTLDKPNNFDIWFTKLLVRETVRIYRDINPDAFISTESEKASVKDCPTLRLDTYDEKKLHVPEKFYDLEDVKNILTRVNGTCSNEQLICGVLYYFAGLSVVDIAEGLGCTVTIVKMKLAHLVELVSSGIGTMTEEGLDTFGMKLMDFYTCLLYININQVWYISQDVSNNIMSKVLTAINRGTEEKTIEIKYPDVPYEMPDHQSMAEDWMAPDIGNDTSEYSEKTKGKGIFSGVILGIATGIIIGIIILGIIIFALKIKADNKDEGSDKNIRNNTETVTTEEDTAASYDPDVNEDNETPDFEEPDDRDNKEEKDNYNQNKDNGISGSDGVSGSEESENSDNTENGTSGNVGGSSQDNSSESDHDISGGSM